VLARGDWNAKDPCRDSARPSRLSRVRVRETPRSAYMFYSRSERVQERGAVSLLLARAARHMQFSSQCGDCHV